MLMWVVLSSNFNTLLKATQVISPLSCAVLGFTGDPGVVLPGVGHSKIYFILFPLPL